MTLAVILGVIFIFLFSTLFPKEAKPFHPPVNQWNIKTGGHLLTAVRVPGINFIPGPAISVIMIWVVVVEAAGIGKTLFISKFHWI